MNIVESLYLCYRGLARTRSIFRDPRYQQPDHVLVSKLSNEEINGALLNVLVRVKSKTFFCVQLRVDDTENQQRYYTGINRRYENICVAYIYVTPMHRPLLAYLWTEGVKIKDLNREVIRQAFIGAEEVNLPMLTQLCRLPIRFDDSTAASDGNTDKASVCDASDLPWELAAAQTVLRNFAIATVLRRTKSALPGKVLHHASEAKKKHHQKRKVRTKSMKKLTQTGVAFSETSVSSRKPRRKNMETCFSSKNCCHEQLASKCWASTARCYNLLRNPALAAVNVAILTYIHVLTPPSAVKTISDRDDTLIAFLSKKR